MIHQACVKCKHSNLAEAICTLGVYPAGVSPLARSFQCPSFKAGLLPPWSPDEEEYQAQLHGRYTIDRQVPMVNARFWVKAHALGVEVRSYTAIRNKCRHKRLDFRYATGDLTLADTARELGIKPATLWSRLHRMAEEAKAKGVEPRVKPYGTYAKFIKQEDLPYLKSLYPNIKGEYYTVPETANRLGYTVVRVRMMARLDMLPGSIRKGMVWHIPRATVERMVRDQIHSGAVNRTWDRSQFPKYAEYIDKKFAPRRRIARAKARTKY